MDKLWMSGWWYTYLSEKYERQLAWSFPKYGKIKNVPNHQPVYGSSLEFWNFTYQCLWWSYWVCYFFRIDIYIYIYISGCVEKYEKKTGWRSTKWFWEDCLSHFQSDLLDVLHMYMIHKNKTYRDLGQHKKG